MDKSARSIVVLRDVREVNVPSEQSHRFGVDTASVLVWTDGGGELRTDSKDYPVRGGIVALYECAAPFTLIGQTAEPLRGLLIEYDTLAIERLPDGRIAYTVEQRWDASPTPDVMEADESLLKTARRLATAKERGELGNPLSGNRLLYELLYGIDRCRSRREEQVRRDPIARVLAHIDSTYSRKLTREALARVAGMNVKSFTAAFREETGVSFSAYINALRIRKAQEQLLRSGGTLNEIAHQVGYKDEFYLSKKFKQVTGIAPSVYVKRPKVFASMDHAYTLDFVTLGISPSVAMVDSWLVRRYRPLLGAGECRSIDWSWDRPSRYRLLVQTTPDVIVCAEDDGEEIEQLGQIAPVVQIPWKGIGWREHFRLVAELAGRKQAAADWLECFDERVWTAKRVLDGVIGPHETVAILNCRADRLSVYREGYMGADLLYDTLALKRPQAVERLTGAREWKTVDLSELALITADYWLVAIEPTPLGRLRARELTGSTEWERLKSAANGRVCMVDMSKWYGYGPAAIEAQLEEWLALLRRMTHQ